MESDQLLRLSTGSLAVELAPSVGGCIARFDAMMKGVRMPLMRGAEGVPTRVLDAACFPLVPFCNRIRDGGFTFRGREIRIAPNMAGDASPLHGHGWLAAWEVRGADAISAELGYRHVAAADWPWDYEARQHFALGSEGLSLRLTCRNLSDAPMPCGLGLHPYFPCAPETRLDTEVRTAWTIDDKVLPVAEVPAEGRYDLRDRRVCGQDLDNGFGGWNGRARITTPDMPGVEISSDDAHFFQLYSPMEGGLFVAEPVSHANAALNASEDEWKGLGMNVLEPREEMALNARFALVPA